VLIEEMKLDGNLLLCDFLEVDDVQTLDSVLRQDVRVVVNIPPPTMDDKDLVHEYTKIRQSGLS
jgi:hypothetical protein